MTASMTTTAPGCPAARHGARAPPTPTPPPPSPPTTPRPSPRRQVPKVLRPNVGVDRKPADSSPVHLGQRRLCTEPRRGARALFLRWRRGHYGWGRPMPARLHGGALLGVLMATGSDRNDAAPPRGGHGGQCGLVQRGHHRHRLDPRPDAAGHRGGLHHGRRRGGRAQGAPDHRRGVRPDGRAVPPPAALAGQLYRAADGHHAEAA